jgi:integrase
MASISSAPGGLRTIQFVDPLEGKRKSIRLGKCSMKLAEEFKIKTEHLVATKAAGSHPDPTLIAWVNALGDDLYAKLEAVGLIQGRGKASLGAFLDNYAVGRTDVKESTLRVVGTSKARIVKFFGADKSLRDINEGDADDFAIWLKSQGYAPATVSRTIKHARQFFRAAMRKKLVASNPFLELKIPSMVNRTRAFFITREMAQAVLDACPDLQWRLIFALSRFGGLRCPSEHLNLRWEDIDWANDKIRIRSPKKEADDDGGERLLPIFPELRGLLTEAFEQAEVGEPFVITRYRDFGQNLGTQMNRVIRRAGLKPWPRTFQNLRASRETELAAEYPLHVVCEWIGNSARVASAHYLQITDQDYKKASAGGAISGAVIGETKETSAGLLVQKPVQHAAAMSRNSAAESKKTSDFSEVLRGVAASCDSTQFQLEAPPGFEPGMADLQSTALPLG